MVTGGGSGIGRAIALKFAAHGAAVRVLDLNLADAEDTCKEIAASKGNAEAYVCDITNQNQVKEIFAKAGCPRRRCRFW